MARPKKSDAERRERMIGVMVTEDEYERLRVHAFEARKPLAAYVREAALAATSKRRTR